MFTRARIQLTVAYSAALALVLLLVGAVTYVLLSRALDADIDSAIEGAAEELRAIDPGLLMADGSSPTAEGTPTPTPSNGDDDDEEDDDEREHGSDDDSSGPGDSDDSHEEEETPAPAIAALPADVFYVTSTLSGAVLSNPRQVNLTGGDLAHVAAEAQAGEHREDISTDAGRFRVAAYPTSLTSAGEPVFLIVGHALEGRERDLETLLQTLLVAGGLGVVVSVAGGYWLSGRALSPIRRTLESQQRFVSDASHELRTPLAVLRANNELLLRHPEQGIGENLEQVEAVALEAEHMSRLVDDLLTLARADEGRLLGRGELVDAAEICAELVRDLQPLADRKSIRLSLAASPSLMEGDPQRLRQLVLILLDNAVKYTPQGGSVEVHCQRASRTVTIAIGDTGPGIPAPDRERVFERFARLESARGRTDTGGSGLGLAIAREIAVAHGGQLGVEARPEGGSLFIARLRASP
jgi:signal transduction histidine kinase